MIMDRAQFMEQLKRLLSDIAEYERDEALDYYESYFDDAGPENEAAVIRELGSPGKVAAIIKADLEYNGGSDAYAEYTELGYEDARTREPGQVPDKYTAVDRTRNQSQAESEEKGDQGNRQESTSSSQDDPFAGKRYQRAGAGSQSFGRGDSHSEGRTERAQRGYHAQERRSNAKGILLLILLVFLSPVITGAAGGIFGVLITIILLPFLLVFGFGAGGIGCMIGAAACLAAGIGLSFTHIASGILTIGIGFILLALGIVLFVLAVWLGGKVVPWLIRKGTDLIHNILQRGRKEGAGS